jgi:hypothetical protein
MKKSPVLLSILFIANLCFCGPAFSLSYYSYDEWGGTWKDANKSITNPDDDLLCWAAAASNVLAWTNWGFPQSQTFQNESDIFSYYVQQWPNVGGGAYAAWSWWFKGQNYDNGVPGGAFWTPTYDFNEYVHVANGDITMPLIANFLHAGYGVAMELSYQTMGHLVTVWGYEYDSNGNYLGLYLTDSDDSIYGIRYAEMYEIDGILHLRGAGDPPIYMLNALAQFPDVAPVPEPSTLLLLSTGLAGLGGVAWRHRKN